ncbi:hypothetical protein HZ326_15912 [Fusarium oxysporum f. sp. albedinis]|nr:hypothetical protein HZ326_15912 [Fusarium oxysporum f. sp. albedinis]
MKVPSTDQRIPWPCQILIRPLIFFPSQCSHHVTGCSFSVPRCHLIRMITFDGALAVIRPLLAHRQHKTGFK